MDKSNYKLFIDAIAGIGAIGQVALSGINIVWGEPNLSFMMLLATMAVVAIGGAAGVWVHNLPLAVFGTIVLYMLGFSFGSFGAYILIFATFLAIASYLEWRRASKESAS